MYDVSYQKLATRRAIHLTAVQRIYTELEGFDQIAADYRKLFGELPSDTLRGRERSTLP